MMTEEILPPKSVKELTPLFIEELFKIKPIDLELYKIAFTHSSASDLNYEKLEFLGDACLSFCVGTFLYTKFPDRDQGWLTITRSKIVNSEALGGFAHAIGLGEYIVLSDELFEKQFHFNNKKILEDVFEALLGAVYTEHGMMVVKRFVIDIIERFVDWTDIEKNRNYKEQLMWHQHKIRAELPVYESEKNEETKQFKVWINLGTHKSSGVHKVKKRAEQLAAKNMLKKLRVPFDE